MKLYDLLNNENYPVEKNEDDFIKKLYKNMFSKKHFFIKDSRFILDILVKYNIETNDLTEDLNIYEELIEDTEEHEYLEDYTSIMNFDKHEILKNIYWCDIYRSYDSCSQIPTFDLYFKVIYGFASLPKYGSENIKNNFISYQIKHFQFQ